jgi:hypothetical protein
LCNADRDDVGTSGNRGAVAAEARTDLDSVTGTRFEDWDTDEPSERGIDGIERMRLVRDDIAGRVADLHARLTRR